MKTLAFAIGMASLGLGTAALAQPQSAAPADPAPPTDAAPPAAAPAPSAAAPVSDAEVTQFASALVAVNEVQKNTALSDTDKQQQMVAKVQEKGLAPQRFNEIAQASQTDTALQSKVQVALAKEQSAASGR